MAAAREAARAALGYWVGLPSYNAALAGAGYEAELIGRRAHQNVANDRGSEAKWEESKGRCVAAEASHEAPRE